MSDWAPEDWQQALWMQADAVGQCPATIIRDAEGWTLDLFGGLSIWRIEWPSNSAPRALMGEAATWPLSVEVRKKASHSLVEEACFESAGAFLEAVTGRELPIPSWAEWLHHTSGEDWGGHSDSPARTVLESRIRTAHPATALTMHVLTALLNHRALAEMLVELAPFGVLSDSEVAASLLRDPEWTCRQMWQPHAKRHMRLLPWCLPMWASEPELSFEGILQALGIDDQLQALLVHMHPTYLYRLADPVLGFKQPELARCFLRLARSAIVADVEAQSQKPHQARTRVGVSCTVIDAAWDAWRAENPALAESQWHLKPTKLV